MTDPDEHRPAPLEPRLDQTFLAPPGMVADWRMVLLFDAAVAVGALDALPGTVADIADQLRVDAVALRVSLDALTAWDIVARQGDHYTRGAAAPSAESAAVLRHHARALRSWSAGLDTRLRGRPLDAGPGMLDPEIFVNALAATARRMAPGIVDLCLARFPGTRSVIDLGGGHGEYSLEFARRGIKTTLQDLPSMVDVVRRQGRLAEADVELVAGSFFDEVPGGPFDLAFCAGTTHTFDGDHNRILFGRLRPVVPAGGGVALVTFLRNRRPLADIFAVQMLVNANGGDSHSEDEYRDWLSGAGFRLDAAAVDIPGAPQSVVFAT